MTIAFSFPCDWMIDPDLKRLRRPLTKVGGTFPRERSSSGIQSKQASKGISVGFGEGILDLVVPVYP